MMPLTTSTMALGTPISALSPYDIISGATAPTYGSSIYDTDPKKVSPYVKDIPLVRDYSHNTTSISTSEKNIITTDNAASDIRLTDDNLVDVLEAQTQEKIAANAADYQELLRLSRFAGDTISGKSLSNYFSNASDDMLLMDKIRAVRNLMIESESIVLNKSELDSRKYYDISSDEFSFGDDFPDGKTELMLPNIRRFFSEHNGKNINVRTESSGMSDFSLRRFYPSIRNYYYDSQAISAGSYSFKGISNIGEYYASYAKAVMDADSLRYSDIYSLKTSICRSLFDKLFKNELNDRDNSYPNGENAWRKGFSNDRDPMIKEFRDGGIIGSPEYDNMLSVALKGQGKAFSMADFDDCIDWLCYKAVICSEEYDYRYRISLEKKIQEEEENVKNSMMSLKEYQYFGHNITLNTVLADSVNEIGAKIQSDWNDLISNQDILRSLMNVLAFNGNAIRIIFGNISEYASNINAAYGELDKAKKALADYAKTNYANGKLYDKHIIDAYSQLVRIMRYDGDLGLNTLDSTKRLKFLYIFGEYLKSTGEINDSFTMYENDESIETYGSFRQKIIYMRDDLGDDCENLTVYYSRAMEKWKENDAARNCLDFSKISKRVLPKGGK